MGRVSLKCRQTPLSRRLICQRLKRILFQSVRSHHARPDRAPCPPVHHARGSAGARDSGRSVTNRVKADAPWIMTADDDLSVTWPGSTEGVGLSCPHTSRRRVRDQRERGLGIQNRHSRPRSQSLMRTGRSRKPASRREPPSAKACENAREAHSGSATNRGYALLSCAAGRGAARAATPLSSARASRSPRP